MELIDLLCFSTTVLSTWMSQQKNKEVQRCACIVGLVSSSFWFVMIVDHFQYNREILWAILLTTIFMTLSWILGLYNNFIVRNK